MRVRPGPIPLNQMEISLRTEYEQYPTLPGSHPGSVGAESQGHFKTHEVSFDVDVESGPKK